MSTPARSSGTDNARTVLLIDDVRSFKDGRPCAVARTSAQGMSLLQAHRGTVIDELWLDHDLAGKQSIAYDETVLPVVHELVQAAATASPYDVGMILVHSSSPRGAVTVRQALARAGYRVALHSDPRIWTLHPGGCPTTTGNDTDDRSTS